MADEPVLLDDAHPTDEIAPEYQSHVAAQRRAAGRGTAAPRAASGQLGERIFVEAGATASLLRVAAQRASGLWRAGSGEAHSQVLWVDGDNALAVHIARVDTRLDEGTITVRVPVRCDQTGDALIEVLFATGSADRPAGLYAATQRRPRGPEIIVATWGDSIVAFAWEVVLGMVSGLAAAAGKDTRGNVLVPVEMVASKKGLMLQPMARHRFTGGSGLKPMSKPLTGGVATPKEPASRRARR